MSEVNKSQAAAGVINFGEVVVTQDKKFKPQQFMSGTSRIC